MNYSGGRLENPESSWFELFGPGTPDSPVRRSSAHFGFFFSFVFDP
jgi:hypothetical protein